MIQEVQMQMEIEHEVEFNFIDIEIFSRGAVDDLKFNIEMQIDRRINLFEAACLESQGRGNLRKFSKSRETRPS